MVCNAKTCSCFFNYFTTTWFKWLKTLNLQVNLCCCNRKHRILVMPKMHDKLTFVMLNFLWGKFKNRFFVQYCRLLKFNPGQNKNIVIVQNNYHGCQYPSDTRINDISSHGIGFFCLQYSCYSIRKRVINFVQNTHNVISSRSGLCSTLTAIVLWAILSYTGLILGFHPANERHRYKVTASLIGWVQT